MHRQAALFNSLYHQSAAELESLAVSAPGSRSTTCIVQQSELLSEAPYR